MFKNLSTQALGISGTQNEVIELALSHGFKGLDLEIGEFQKQVEARGLAVCRRLWDSAKLRLGRFALPFPVNAEASTYSEAIGVLDAQAKLAAEVGCTRAVTRIDPASDELPYHQNFELHRKRLAEIAGILATHGMQLGVGFQAAAQLREGRTFQFLYDLDPLLMLLGLVGKSNVGLALDVWDLHIAGKGLDSIRKLNVPIVSVELADFPADVSIENATQQNRLLPCESGQIDAPAILTYLAEKGYDGPVTPAPDRAQFSGQRREEIGRRTGQALDTAWKAAGLSAAGKLQAAARK